MAGNGNSWTLGRRIRAAMALAGIGSFTELAKAIGHEGLGTRTLRKIADDNDDSRDGRRLELVAIANACGVPYEFFTVDFSTLENGASGLAGQVAELRAEVTRSSARLALLEEAVRELGAKGPQQQREEGSA